MEYWRYTKILGKGCPCFTNRSVLWQQKRCLNMVLQAWAQCKYNSLDWKENQRKGIKLQLRPSIELFFLLLSDVIEASRNGVMVDFTHSNYTRILSASKERFFACMMNKVCHPDQCRPMISETVVLKHQFSIWSTKGIDVETGGYLSTCFFQKLFKGISGKGADKNTKYIMIDADLTNARRLHGENCTVVLSYYRSTGRTR